MLEVYKEYARKIANVSFVGSTNLSLRACFESILREDNPNFREIDDYLRGKSDPARGAFNLLAGASKDNTQHPLVETALNTVLLENDMEPIISRTLSNPDANTAFQQIFNQK